MELKPLKKIEIGDGRYGTNKRCPQSEGKQYGTPSDRHNTLKYVRCKIICQQLPMATSHSEGGLPNYGLWYLSIY